MEGPRLFPDAWKGLFEEVLIRETMEAAVIAGGRADLLLTHKSPVHTVPQVQAIVEGNPLRWPAEALAVSGEQRERV